MGKRGAASRPKDEESVDIGPDSDEDTTDSELAKNASVEPLFKKSKTVESAKQGKKEVEPSDEDEEEEEEEEEEKAKEDPLKVCVRHIPWSDRDKKEVTGLFNGCGGIVHTELPPHIGFLTFDSEKAVKKALQLDGTELRGSKLKVTMAPRRTKGPAKDLSARNKARKLRAKERRREAKSKSAGEKPKGDALKTPPVESAEKAEGEKAKSKTRRSKRKKKAKDGEEKAPKDKNGRLPLAEYKKKKAEDRKTDTRSKEERRNDYAQAAKRGAKGRGAASFTGRGGGRGRGGDGVPFTGRGGGKPFAGRGGGESKKDD